MRDHAMTLALGTPSERSLLQTPARRIAWRWWAIWLAGFGVFSMMMPRDASFDVLHYHLHNGWAVLNGRAGQDLAPAEMHSFLNPLWQVFVWQLIELLPGRAVAFVLGVLQGLILPALYALTRRLLDRAGSRPSLVTVLAICLVGFSGEMQFGLMASARNDAVCAAVFLGALVLLLPERTGGAGVLPLALASLLMGALFGLKPTNGVYVLFFAIAIMIMADGWSARLRAAGICALAGLAGILLTGGAWAWHLYEAYGNPIFPQLNTFFDAPLGPDTAFRDNRYLPGGVGEAMLRPFVFLFDGALVNEHHFFDPRLQIGYVAAFGMLGLVAARPGKAWPAGREAVALSVGLIVSLLAWSLVFSIARYYSAGWLIGPAMFALFVAMLRPAWLGHAWAPFVSLGVAAALFATTQLAELRRVPWQGWSEPYVTAEVPAMPGLDHAVIAFSGGYPSAFLAPFFPQTAQMTHLVPQEWSAPALANYRGQIRDLIAEPGRPLYVVIVDTEGHFTETVEKLMRIEHVTVETGACKVIDTNFATPETVWKICPADVKRPAP
ncbi:hypothetical protein [Henriciella aquimarina]|uniref:hypothetical protein n=1 Tax=Henriciella aquimarina TaxID=545261 RepID=UPI00117B0518|nr:hypothetical protein [Henriciella aquimarina]